MKTIATIIASLLLSLGLLVSPASAEEPAPVDCDETIQAWKDRALAAEARASALSTDLFFAQSEVRSIERRATIVEARLGFTERLLADTKADLIDKQQQFYRQFNKIQRQKLTIARLREQLWVARHQR
jgi:hypothetical protein